MNKILFFELFILFTCKISISMNPLVPKLRQTSNFELLWQTTTEQEKENCGVLWLLALRNFRAVRPRETEEGFMCPIRKCKSCETDQRRLEKHLVAAHASQLQCACVIPWCCSRFVKCRNVNDHLRKFHKIIVNPTIARNIKKIRKRPSKRNFKITCYRCPECNYYSTMKKRLWDHVRTVHHKSLSWIGNCVQISPPQHKKK